MTRLGNFLKFSVTKFLTIVAKIFIDLLGYFESYHFLTKITLDIFWVTLGKIWLLFILASGHTDDKETFGQYDYLPSQGVGTRPNRIKIFQHSIFYATVIFKHSDWLLKFFNQS